MDILDEIVAHKREELEDFRSVVSPASLYDMVEPLLDTPVPSMRAALEQSESGIIAEFKRKSPSRGWIHRDARAAEVPLAYEQNGASALSILTDMKYFGGDDEFIRQARHVGVTLPILYKNFIVDAYQLLQARLCGASAVLLIAACLSHEECEQLLDLTHQLGMEALLEMHSERDLDYADLPADMMGINNRNLGTFITSVDNSFRMAERLPKEACKVSESGISNPDTVRQLRQAGYRGFLMGEHFMKAENPGSALRSFIETLKQ